MNSTWFKNIEFQSVFLNVIGTKLTKHRSRFLQPIKWHMASRDARSQFSYLDTFYTYIIYIEAYFIKKITFTIISGEI